MRGSLIVSVLFLAASSLSAQDTKTATVVMQGKATTLVIKPSGDCPIGFFGDLTSPSTTELLAKGTTGQYPLNGTTDPALHIPTQDKRPHLELSFDGSKATAKLLKVHVTVYGSPKGPHVMLVNSGTDGFVAEDFDLTTQAKIAATSFHSDVYPQTMGVAQWAEISQIDYADGSTWHASSTSTCKVSLTGFKRVDSAR
ncbi:hypothetical protein [Granulicella mallensis]|uniref:Uncharacterized protein n=1 Tax=Granulicella mallensis (strain ATCC BAA-1857 / DSM 23137 / MP5ACTX8) TaxID=682795 RepID=G8P171_GRAMM|nr:hypothetical protein [Granulicella mallensis]AEU38089.1 hypothetical protein AciX8_3805 [Granulicella mallensis MP5ACTX8]